LCDNKNVEGLTIKEMAEILGIAPAAVKQRLFVAQIKPMTKDAVYDKSALEAIRDVPGKGRPRKKAGEDKPENTI
jgi:predicted ArsR family transcriptional regulator